MMQLQARDIPILGFIFLFAINTGKYVVSNFTYFYIIGFSMDNIPVFAPFASTYYLTVALLALIGVIYLLRKKRKK